MTINKGLSKDYRNNLIILLFIAVSVISVYWQVINFDFIYYDDPKYVRDNPVINKGITGEGLQWAFISLGYASNWHPLTWISHMLDVEIFGVVPGMHHLMNVLFHLCNSILLFFLFCRLTGDPWKSTAVALMFAVHPLHVESVAWISERKDVLSTLFWILTIWTYFKYVMQRSIVSYITILFLFTLGLLSKPMLVTLPFVLLLLDVWPIRRAELMPGSLNTFDQSTIISDRNSHIQLKGFIPLLYEKIPLFFLSALSCVMTFMAQRKGGAMSNLEGVSLADKVSNALIAYVNYIIYTFWPLHLSILYPYPMEIDIYHTLGSLLILILVTVCALLLFKKFPYLLIGWLWYLGTLIPVIGIIQVGYQSMADRYTYIPLIGIFIMLVWGISSLLNEIRARKYILALSMCMVTIVLAWLSWNQVSLWRSTESIFTHALQVTENNYVAHTNLGAALLQQGDIVNGIFHSAEALKIKPDHVIARSNLGVALMRQKKYSEGIVQFRKVIQDDPDNIKAHLNLGLALTEVGRVDEASKEIQLVLRKYPDYSGALSVAERIRQKERYIDDKIMNLNSALAREPQNHSLHVSLAELYRLRGRITDSIFLYQKAVDIDPQDFKAMYDLASIYASINNYDKALSILENMKRAKPDDSNVYYNLACVLSRQGKVEESLKNLDTAFDKGFSDYKLLETDPDLDNVRSTEGYNRLVRVFRSE